MLGKREFVIVAAVLALLVVFGCESKTPETPPEQPGADTAEKPAEKPTEKPTEEPAEKPKESTPEATAAIWVKGMNEGDADALYDIYCKEIIEELEDDIERARKGGENRRERFCKNIGLAIEKLDTLTAKEFHKRALPIEILARIDKMHGKDWKFALVEPVNVEIEGNVAAVRLKLMVDDEEKIAFDLALTKDGEAWKMGPAFPRMEGAGRANEAAAMASLKNICTAQELHRMRHGQYGDCTDLNDGKDKQYIDVTLAKADPDYPHHAPKYGYVINITVNEDGTEWFAIATPVRWGIDGSRNFKIDITGVTYYNTTEGDTTNFKDAAE